MSWVKVPLRVLCHVGSVLHFGLSCLHRQLLEESYGMPKGTFLIMYAYTHAHVCVAARTRANLCHVTCEYVHFVVYFAKT